MRFLSASNVVITMYRGGLDGKRSSIIVDYDRGLNDSDGRFSPSAGDGVASPVPSSYRVRPPATDPSATNRTTSV